MLVLLFIFVVLSAIGETTNEIVKSGHPGYALAFVFMLAVSFIAWRYVETRA
jgi:hypothetical protein